MESISDSNSNFNFNSSSTAGGEDVENNSIRYCNSSNNANSKSDSKHFQYQSSEGGYSSIMGCPPKTMTGGKSTMEHPRLADITNRQSGSGHSLQFDNIAVSGDRPLFNKILSNNSSAPASDGVNKAAVVNSTKERLMKYMSSRGAILNNNNISNSYSNSNLSNIIGSTVRPSASNPNPITIYNDTNDNSVAVSKSSSDRDNMPFSSAGIPSASTSTTSPGQYDMHSSPDGNSIKKMNYIETDINSSHNNSTYFINNNENSNNNNTDNNVMSGWSSGSTLRSSTSSTPYTSGNDPREISASVRASKASSERLSLSLGQSSSTSNTMSSSSHAQGGDNFSLHSIMSNFSANSSATCNGQGGGGNSITNTENSRMLSMSHGHSNNASDSNSLTASRRLTSSIAGGSLDNIINKYSNSHPKYSEEEYQQALEDQNRRLSIAFSREKASLESQLNSNITKFSNVANGSNREDAQRIEDLMEELHGVRSEMEQKDFKLRKLDDDCKSLEADKKAMYHLLQTLQSSEESSIQGLSLQHRDMQRVCEDLKRSLQLANQDIDSLSNQANHWKAESEGALARCQKLEYIHRSLQTKIEDMKIEQVEAVKQAREHVYNKAMKSIDDGNKEVRRMKAYIAEMQQENSTNKAHIHNLQGNLEQLSSSLEAEQNLRMNAEQREKNYSSNLLSCMNSWCQTRIVSEESQENSRASELVNIVSSLQSQSRSHDVSSSNVMDAFMQIWQYCIDSFGRAYIERFDMFSNRAKLQQSIDDVSILTAKLQQHQRDTQSVEIELKNTQTSLAKANFKSMQLEEKCHQLMDHIEKGMSK